MNKDRPRLLFLSLPSHALFDRRKHLIRSLVRHTDVPALVDAHAPAEERSAHVRINREQTALSHQCSRRRQLPYQPPVAWIHQDLVHNLSKRQCLPLLSSTAAHVPQMLIVAAYSISSVRDHLILMLDPLWEHAGDSHGIPMFVKDTIPHLEHPDANVATFVCNRNQLIIWMSLASSRRGKQDRVTHLGASQSTHQ